MDAGVHHHVGNQALSIVLEKLFLAIRIRFQLNQSYKEQINEHKDL